MYLFTSHDLFILFVFGLHSYSTLKKMLVSFSLFLCPGNRDWLDLIFTNTTCDWITWGSIWSSFRHQLNGVSIFLVVYFYFWVSAGMCGRLMFFLASVPRYPTEDCETRFKSHPAAPPRPAGYWTLSLWTSEELFRGRGKTKQPKMKNLNSWECWTA